MGEQPLKVGERVVWFRDSGQEHGVVRWLGQLDPDKDDLLAGVEFVSHFGVDLFSHFFLLISTILFYLLN